MKVAILNITSGGMSGGYKKYLQNLIPRLTANDQVNRILCISPSVLAVDKWFDDDPKVSFLSNNIKAFSPKYHLINKLNEFSPDVIYLPVERAFKYRNVPVVTMIQNMEPLVPVIKGNTFAWRFEHMARRTRGKRAVINADRVIAISQFVQDFLCTQWNIPRNRIELVYHGINQRDESEGIRPVLIPGNWDNNFIFTAGSIRPARGLSDLIQAMKYLMDMGDNSLKLVVAGENGPKSKRYMFRLKEMARQNHIDDRICWTGQLNREEMTWCYKNCKLFVMTSRVESFGQIAGEALSNGCVSISTNSACLPEVFGDAAVYYKAGDSSGLAEKVQSLISLDKKQREIISEQAASQAGKFTWDICAQRTLQALQNAISECRV